MSECGQMRENGQMRGNGKMRGNGQMRERISIYVDSRPAISTRLDVKLGISCSVTWSSPDFDQKVPRSWSLVLHRLTTMSIMGDHCDERRRCCWSASRE